MNKIKDYKAKYPLTYHKDVLTGPFAVEEIYRQTNGEAIITTEVGQHQMWAAQYYKYTKPRTLLTSGGLGTMGYGLGAAIGAKTGCPDKIVVNIAVAYGSGSDCGCCVVSGSCYNFTGLRQSKFCCYFRF